MNYLVKTVNNPMNTEKSDLFFSLIALAVVLAGIVALALKLDQSFPI